MAFPKKKYAKKRTFKRSYTKSVVKKAKRRNFAKSVKRVIQRSAEKKVAYFESDAQDMQNFSNTTSNNNTIVLTPYSGSAISISQGTGQANRIGDSINVTHATLSFTMRPLPYDATENSVPMPQVILCYLWKLKTTDRNIVGAATVTTGSFFQQGNSSTGITGILDDYLKNINKDKVILLKKFYVKLGSSNYGTNTGVQHNQFDYSNNDFKMCILKKINISRYIKRVKWNDTDSVPSFNPLYFTVNPCDADGGANASTTAAVPAMWSYRIQYQFTDI